MRNIWLEYSNNDQTGKRAWGKDKSRRYIDRDRGLWAFDDGNKCSKFVYQYHTF